jgi:hypothetical protein
MVGYDIGHSVPVNRIFQINMWYGSFIFVLKKKIYPESEGYQIDTHTVQKQQLTSAGMSTISNWYAISGKRPIAKAKMAPAEPTILYRRALFSVRLSIYGWPCKINISVSRYVKVAVTVNFS